MPTPQSGDSPKDGVFSKLPDDQEQQAKKLVGAYLTARMFRLLFWGLKVRAYEIWHEKAQSGQHHGRTIEDFLRECSALRWVINSVCDADPTHDRVRGWLGDTKHAIDKISAIARELKHMQEGRLSQPMQADYQSRLDQIAEEFKHRHETVMDLLRSVMTRKV